MENTGRLNENGTALKKGKQAFLYNKLRPRATRTTAKTKRPKASAKPPGRGKTEGQRGWAQRGPLKGLGPGENG